MTHPDVYPVPDDLAAVLSRMAPRLGPFASRVFWYPRISSTNDVAARLAEAGAPEGWLVVADSQTAGRGRRGRHWASPPAAGIYASIVLRPGTSALPLLTLAAGLAIADGIRAATGLRVGVKWPNDVYVEAAVYGGSRKIAGILAEAGSASDRVQHVALGFGINVKPAAYPDDVAARATAIETELGQPIDRAPVLAECLAALWTRYVGASERAPAALIAEWRQRAMATFGRRVEWGTRSGHKSGVVEDIDEHGALVVRTDTGRVGIVSGEIRWM